MLKANVEHAAWMRCRWLPWAGFRVPLRLALEAEAWFRGRRVRLAPPAERQACRRLSVERVERQLPLPPMLSAAGDCWSGLAT